MPNKNYFAQLSPSQKAELFLIYTGNGMYNLQEIINHYNSEMERAYSATDKDMVARMHDVNAPYLLDENGNKMTHRMASGEGYVFPTIQRNDNGDLESYEDTEDWGAQRAIDRGDTLQFKLPSLADYFSRNYKTHIDNPNMKAYGGNIDNNIDIYKNVNYTKEDTDSPKDADIYGVKQNALWLASREDILKKNAEDVGYSNTDNIYDDEIRNMVYTPTSYNGTNTIEYGRVTPNKTDENGVMTGDLVYTRMQAPIYDEETGDYVQESYLPLHSTVHERAHTLGIDKPQDVLIGKWMLEHGYNDPYYDKGTEVYSRLMEVRDKYSIDPYHIWTKEEIENLIKDVNENSNHSYNILDRYDIDTLLYLFNEIAAAQSGTVDMSNIASNGGMLIRRFDMGGDFRKFFKNLFGKKVDKENNTPKYLDYWNAKDYLSDSFFTKKSGKYNIESVGDYGDTHFDVVSARYKGLINAMNNNGFSEEEISRLLPFLVTQNVLEGGYRVSRSDNNFGGIMMPGTSKKRVFDTEEDFYNYYLRNLDEKWGDDVLGKGRGWRNAKTIKEYADIINREDLKLYSKEAYDEYNRTHRDAPAYIYTPMWENNNTGLMSDTKFGGIYPRVYGMLDILAKRMKEWENFAKTNKIYKKD